ncbi:ABC transporter ATP-binding protein [Herbaspirillum sp.]|jgi:branched-chain amino acid transport system ATP-binding protein|uniref:ABC transporter ATP-binding protein n=1 Tax=Herbaspirillum TaxID=963 RepID=UPI00258431C3|nr:ABC transporter ATP-binding protein [Herbaspirillum sp.]MCP3653771.1 ABC transporter ATP-binding protein [Herbaspirillum sp.]MCP3947851.1 ABC transporter ATP-binding protein [Herbaspirillum sp.]MCP4032668.1 ABC transporter ATP-binding protein [Herbaspirillum sp.]MCP4555728.1 ABC transporter ATP-binding protein [Herbaspirillum sp.]
MSLLQIDGLRKSFGGVAALDGVSFTLPAGEMLALIGPNGAGKSTCFNVINGQLRPDAGRVLLDGEDIAGLDARRIWRRGVGRTFQVSAAFASLTVLENVQAALLSHRRRLWQLWRPAAACLRDEAMALLAQVGMADQATRACGVLAYGDIKRVELAMALSNAPRLLLMDEPTAGMAPRERQELMALTRRLVSERGLSVLFTEHSMDVVFSFADRIIVLARGQLIAQGLPEEVRQDARVREVYFGSGASFGSPA